MTQPEAQAREPTAPRGVNFPLATLAQDTPPLRKIGGSLNILVQAGYDEAQIVEPFQKLIDVKVNSKVFPSSDEMFSILSASKPGDWDITVPDTPWIAKLVEAGMLAKLNPADYPIADQYTRWQKFDQWYRAITTTPDLLASLRNSIVVGLAVATASVTLGFFGAYGLTRWSFRGKDIYVLAMLSPLAVPWVLLGLGFVIYFNELGIPRSLGAVWISHTVFAAPLALVMIRARLASLPPSYEEAARDLGASRLRAITTVVWPLTAPAVIAAFLLTFTMSFDEFILAWFVSGFNVTLPVKIWTMLRTGLTPTVSAVGVLIFASSITLTVAAELLLQRRTTA